MFHGSNDFVQFWWLDLQSFISGFGNYISFELTSNYQNQSSVSEFIRGNRKLMSYVYKFAVASSLNLC